ncbi:conjugative relaxase-like TrwC/TraI family protein [Williamsia limnetica]|uniref:Conjugative relaxase-like TrwC/TraI family protein n=1 Tax=Williamsia limnetica TaxID=882452 RepID=A0A318RD09_WILLI|nr:MobF family relaxase [Williamsia limnetica]PYE13482.1 conjugative relaxase-like TrwC/TraI family protein [Williamsia limnetica]
MTLHVLHAGDGYSYLTDQVASADRERERGQELADYYTAHGTPPGMWWGDGLIALEDERLAGGRAHEALMVNGTVAEAQMKALFGEALHPNADALIESMIDEGMKPDAAIKAARLGRRFPKYSNDIELVNATEMSAAAFVADHKRRPTVAELREIERGHGRRLFEDDKGRAPLTDRELVSWMAHEKGKVRQPVAGFDLVFTPPKSVSVLWALGDENTRRTIERCHHEAVNDAITHLQKEAIFTRSGASGELQVDTKGLIVAQFDHYDSRAGDPNFHTHAAVSQKVQGTDGVWRSIDSKALHRAAVAHSQRYNGAVMDLVCRELGVGREVRDMGEGRQAVIEIAGVLPELREGFSGRRTAIEARYDELLRTYRDEHGYMPAKRTMYRMMQQANLDTREGKQTGASLAELRVGWRDRALAIVGSERALGRMMDRVMGRESAVDRPFEGVQPEAEQVIEKLSQRRSSWTMHQLRGAAEAHVATVAFDDPAARRAAIDAVIDHARGQVIALATPEFAPTPAALQRANGESQLVRHDETLLTTTAVLAAEDRVHAAAATPTGHVLTRAHVGHICEQLQAENGRELNPGQRALVEHFTGSGALLAVGVGPAGAGKTTAMTAATRAWEAAGHNVIALAPSAVAAENLGEEIGIDGITVARLTYPYRGKMADSGIAAGTIVESVPIGPGTVLLVDEASMMCTADWDALVSIAHERGAIIRALGDPAQLDAVESGGLLRSLAEHTYAPELDEVVRFGDDHVQAKNSMDLRAGDPAAIDLYARRGWVHDGTLAELKTHVVDDHIADLDAGRNSIVLASTVNDVRELNQAIQSIRRADGVARTGRLVGLSDQHMAGVGDQVVTRSNNRRPDGRTKGGTRPGSYVRNGDVWTVVKVHRDKTLTLRHRDHHGTVRLSADYVREHTELGYAMTIHRAQGLTVDVTRMLHSVSTNLSGLYVGLTRGRSQNHAYVPLDQELPIDVEKVHVDGVQRAPTAIELLKVSVGRDNGQRTATEELRTALAAAHDPERLAIHYHAGQRILRDAYLDRVLEQALPETIHHTMREAHPDSYYRLREVLVTEHDAGGHPVHLLTDALGDHRSLADAHDPAALIVHRISELRATTPLPARTDPDWLAPLPPRHPGIDAELADWCAAGAAAHQDAVARRTDPLTGAVADYRRTLADIDRTRLDTGLAVLPAEDRPQVEHDPETARLSALLGRAERAGHTPDKVVAIAARDLYAAERDISAAAIADHIEQSLPRAQAVDRRRWLEENATAARHLAAARIDLSDPQLAGIVDDIRDRERATGEAGKMLVSRWVAGVARDRDDPTADRDALVSAWRTLHPDPTRGAVDPAVPPWIPAPPLGDSGAGARYQAVADAVRQEGRSVAEQRPLWSEALGDRPTEPATQQRWEQLAGHVAAWRSEHQIDVDEHPLGSMPEAGNGRGHYKNLERALNEHQRAMAAEREHAARAAESEHEHAHYNQLDHSRGRENGRTHDRGNGRHL